MSTYKEIEQEASQLLKTFTDAYRGLDYGNLNQNYFEIECPSCNGKLSVRSGIYGKFLGCSNYPNCRYTKNFRG